MNQLPTTATAQSTQPDQSTTAFFHVGVVTDPDNGQSTLVGASAPNLGDLQVVTEDQVIAKADEAHRLISKGVKLALDYEAATRQEPADEPRSWTIADRDTGMPLKFTCMPGCSGHLFDLASGMEHADEVRCTQYDQANTTELAIGCGSEDPEDWATLSVEITSHPVHSDSDQRIPLAAVEMTADHYIEDLDPNGLAVVIDKLQHRVNQMRVRHAELVRIRNEYLGRQA
jgi:hypothetical protein